MPHDPSYDALGYPRNKRGEVIDPGTGEPLTQAELDRLLALHDPENMEVVAEVFRPQAEEVREATEALRQGEGPGQPPRPRLAAEDVAGRRRRAGGLRRALSPHRGELLLALGAVSIALGALSFLCVPGLLGFPLACVVYVMADHDLGRMKAGQADPAGRGLADAAQWCALAGAGLSALGILLGCVLLGVPIFSAPG